MAVNALESVAPRKIQRPKIPTWQPVAAGEDVLHFDWKLLAMAFTPRFNPKNAKPRKRPKPKLKTKKKDPIWVDGVRPRPMFVDYKDIELLKKLINRHGKIVSRRKSGCTAVSQHAVALAIKRARFMALLPYVGE